MTDLKRINELIETSDYPVKVIARKMGMSTQSLHNKRTGKREFTVREILSFCEVFNLSKTERTKIFSI